MLHALTVNPNSAVEFKANAKTQAESIGFGFFENIKELAAKESHLQIVGKEAAYQADFLKPEFESYKGTNSGEEESTSELVAKIRALLKQFKQA